jgi:hypothetical protein
MQFAEGCGLNGHAKGKGSRADLHTPRRYWSVESTSPYFFEKGAPWLERPRSGWMPIVLDLAS